MASIKIDKGKSKLRYFVLVENFLFIYKDSNHSNEDPISVTRVDDGTVKQDESIQDNDVVFEITIETLTNKVNSLTMTTGDVFHAQAFREALTSACAYWTRVCTVNKTNKMQSNSNSRKNSIASLFSNEVQEGHFSTMFLAM